MPEKSSMLSDIKENPPNPLFSIHFTCSRHLTTLCYNGVTKVDKIRNERIRWTTKVGEIAKKVQERSLKWHTWACGEKRGALLRMEDDENGSTQEKDERNAYEKMVG